jgi:hypothetical protein
MTRAVLSALLTVCAAGAQRIPPGYQAPYPLSTAITGITFDGRTARTFAPGSDIWPVTWAEDGHLYTVFGDGGGFGGTNKEGRVSLGIARVEGGKHDYRGVNIAGGKGAAHPAPFTGKSEGVLALGNRLYLWRDGELSNAATFQWEELYYSGDRGATWRKTGVRFTKADFPDSDEGFFAPAFCQFERGYRGARDGYVYLYAPDIIDPSHWEMRQPGRVNLIRVPAKELESRQAYRFFAGFDAAGNPVWTPIAGERKPVWADPVNGCHRMAVSFNPALSRYLLTTVTVSRDGWMSVYEAPEPWGPWRTVFVEQNPERWGSRVILFSFVNKWLSADGLRFILVHTRNDTWSTIEGTFEVPGR